MSENMMAMQNGIRPTFFDKWRLLGLISAILALLTIIVLALDPDVDGVRRVIRLTARTSFLLFGLAFTASAAWKRFPNRWMNWQRQNRRYLGLGFAVSHTIHAVAIATYAAMDPVRFHAVTGISNFITGGIAYVFILLMALTSFDRTAAWMGPRAWKVLHTTGIYYLWISFMVAYGKRIPQSSSYVIPLILLCAALAFRLWPISKSQR
ncbi:MAG: hypothetical protein ACXU8A_04230 [Burkholderiaceae bacterium]